MGLGSGEAKRVGAQAAAAASGRAAAVAAVNIRGWEEAVNMKKEEPIELKEQTLRTCLTQRSGGHRSLVEAVQQIGSSQCPLQHHLDKQADGRCQW